MINKKVSVIIPTYNAEKFIERCINKVLEQTYNNIEIIAVDDGSTDSTIALLHAYGNHVKVLQNDVNQGPAYSRTRGLFECNGTFVAFLDADDYWDKDFVSATVTFLEGHTEAVAVSTAYIGINLKGDSIQKPNLNDEDNDLYEITGSICPDFFEFWSDYFGVLTGTVMIRTDIARETKGQRKELRLTEDLEFWGYLSTFGKWGFIPQPLFFGDPGVSYPWERLKKMKDRYDFFKNLSYEVWESRIKDNILLEQKISFQKIENHIITTIAIAKAYSLQYEESRLFIQQHQSHLENGIGSVLKKGLYIGKLLWPLVCLTLRVREFLKSYFSYYVRVSMKKKIR